MELVALVFGCLAIAYVIWAIVSPFIVFGLSSRVHELETEVATLKRERKLAATAGNTARTATDRHKSPETQPASREPSLQPATNALDFSRVEPPAPAEITPVAMSSQDEPVPPPVTPAIPQPTFDELARRRREKAEAVAQNAAAKVVAVEKSETAVVPILSAGSTDETPAATPLKPPTNHDEPTTLEEILAGKWLTWVGALAVIIGAGFGFKYAIENNWIGPRERVIIGILTGLCCFAGGAYAIRRQYVFLAQGLTGSALGILYLSLYAAFGWYGIVSYETAFLGMILTTILGLSFAGYFNVQPTAVLGMLGGFLTPVMLWPSHDPIWTLFPYLLMLDLGVLLIAGVRRWAGLEILAFGGTLWIWFGWHHEFYQASKLGPTIGFLTAFLVLFAFLSVWHNVIRRRAANAGDFFLIFATPTGYFAALYALTYEVLPQWQGGFALSMMLFYGVLAALAAVWHPAGKSVIAALAGLSATFLILAPPLQLTGHFVTMCWIAEAVLLVELGLYFREKALAWTGLSLLAKVQVILLIYFVGTLADPLHFQTAFVRIQLHLIGRPETPIDTGSSWMSLINGRSLSYLFDVCGFALLAWEFGRRRKHPEMLSELIPGRELFGTWLNVMAPVAALVMVILETFAWGTIWHWDSATIVSAWTIWTAVFACGLILWSRLFEVRGIEGLAWLLYALLACFVGFETIDALQVLHLGTAMPAHRQAAWWLLNPRGVSELVLIGSLLLTSLVYANFPPRIGTDETSAVQTPRDLMEVFGKLAYGLSLGLVLLETRVWGAVHGWLPSTIVAVCSLWTAAFLVGLLVSQYWKREKWILGLLRATFLLLSFWFVMNAVGALGLLNRATAGITLSAYDWWSQDIRGLGFLVSTAVCAAAGWLLSRDETTAQREIDDAVIPLPHAMGVVAYVMGLAMVSLETSIWGINQGWLTSTIISSVAIWTTAFMIGAVVWRVVWRADWVDRIVLSTFFALEALLAGNMLLGLVATNLSASINVPATLDWWLFNPRGFGVLVGLLGCATAAWLFEIGKAGESRASGTLPRLLGVAAFVTGLSLVLTELVIGGAARGWLLGSIVGGSAMWIALFAVVLVGWSVKQQTQEYDSLITLLYVGLLAVLIGITLSSVDAVTNQSASTWRAFRPPIEMWFWNPRFMSFLASLAAAGLASWLYRGLNRRTSLPYSELPDMKLNTIDISSLFAITVYVTGVVMFTLEVFMQGTSRDWHTATSLAITLVWTVYATLTLIAGIYWRSGWVRIFSLSLFVLTVLKVFLVDVWHLDTVIRVFAFVSLGVALLLVSFLYRRFRDRIRSWMTPELKLGRAS